MEQLITSRVYLVFSTHTYFEMGTAVAQWLRRSATNRKVAGSISNGVIWNFFIDIIFPIAQMHWGSTQSLTEMSTKNISWG